MSILSDNLLWTKPGSLGLIFLFSLPASGALPFKKLGNQLPNLMEVSRIQMSKDLLAGGGDGEIKFCICSLSYAETTGQKKSSTKLVIIFPAYRLCTIDISLRADVTGWSVLDR